MIKRIINKIKCNPYYIVYWIFKYTGLSTISDYVFLKTHWRLHMGHSLNLKNPKSLSEKLQWIKLYDRKPIYTTMVDKFEVKEFVANKIGEEYIIPTIAIYDSIEDVDIEKLPNRFVIKCTHDSGSVVICKDKSTFDWEKHKSSLKEALSVNYYTHTREWPYKNVKPRILVEEYLTELADEDIKDYKFFCFNGNAKFLKVDYDRFIDHKVNYYDLDWKYLEYAEYETKTDANHIEKMPNNFNQMIEFANILSKDTKFLRVDFYNLNGKIYFGELTFFPRNGFGCLSPYSIDESIGEFLNLEK